VIRRPQARGFYPFDPPTLRRVLKGLFGKVGQGEEFKGGIAPHAGYTFSGLAAASLYRALRKSASLVILGNDHYGNAIDISLHPYMEWETPLGKVPVDEGLAEALDSLGMPVVESFREHSIEVQLPFLQYLWGDFSFLPVTVPQVPINRLRELGRALSELRVPVVATSDMSHYVPHDRATELDSLAIDAFISGGPERFMKVVRDNNISMCGLFPAMVLLYTFPRAERELIMYYTSGDVTGDRSAVVGYASIGVR